MHIVLQCSAALRHRRRPVSARILRDSDGFLHCCKQAITAFTSKSRAKTFRPANKKPHHNVSVLFHALPCTRHKHRVTKNLSMTNKAACNENVSAFTIAEDSKTQKVQVALPLHWVPADVWVSLMHQHYTALQPTASQILHHLQGNHTLLSYTVNKAEHITNITNRTWNKLASGTENIPNTNNNITFKTKSNWEILCM